MVWTWRYEKADGTELPGSQEQFSSQGDAESWIGETWKDLLEQGVEQVTLLEDGQVIYAMSLQAEF